MKLLCACTVILLSVSACASGSTATSDFCLIAQPIYTADNDTEETKRQADEHNAKGMELCGW